MAFKSRLKCLFLKPIFCILFATFLHFARNTTKVHDGYRIEFLNGFIDWMKKAMEEGCDVRGYFVWSTMDLYSWINGYKKRYGLVYIDYDHDNKRILKDSYYWYKTKIQESIRDE